MRFRVKELRFRAAPNSVFGCPICSVFGLPIRLNCSDIDFDILFHPELKEAYRDSKELKDAFEVIKDPLKLGDPILTNPQRPGGQGGGPNTGGSRPPGVRNAEQADQGFGYRIGENVGQGSGATQMRLGQGGGGLPSIRDAARTQVRTKAGVLPAPEVITTKRTDRDWELSERDWLKKERVRLINEQKANRQRQMRQDAFEREKLLLDIDVEQMKQDRMLKEYEAKLEYDKENKKREEIIDALKGTNNLWQTFFGNLFEF